jgi:hypothetical protein
MSKTECSRTYIDINICVCVEITSEICPCILDRPNLIFFLVKKYLFLKKFLVQTYTWIQNFLNIPINHSEGVMSQLESSMRFVV